MEAGEFGSQQEKDRIEILKGYLSDFNFSPRVSEGVEFLLDGGGLFELAQSRGVTKDRERELIKKALKAEEKKLTRPRDVDRDYTKIGHLREVIAELRI